MRKVPPETRPTTPRQSFTLAAILTPLLALSIFASTATARSYNDPAKQAALNQVGAAQHEISRVIVNLRRNFEESSDVQNARSLARSTLANYRAATDGALIPLRETVQYKVVSDQIAKLEQKLTWGTYDDHMTPAQIVATAQTLMNARRAQTAMESAALANDPNVIKARDAMTDASGELVSLQRQFEQSIASNPDFVQAKSRLEAAHAQACGRG